MLYHHRYYSLAFKFGTVVPPTADICREIVERIGLHNFVIGNNKVCQCTCYFYYIRTEYFKMLKYLKTQIKMFLHQLFLFFLKRYKEIIKYMRIFCSFKFLHIQQYYNIYSLLRIIFVLHKNQ